METNSDPRRAPFRLKRRTGRWLIAATVATVSIGGVVAVARQMAETKGKAQVVERRGPEVEVRPNGRGNVVVLFPQAPAEGAAGAQQVEVVLVESQIAAPAAAGQPAAAPSPTGREIVFSSRDASDGIVRYEIEAAGNGRKMTVLARVDGKYVEAHQAGGGEGVMVFTVAQPKPEAPKADTPKPAEGQPAAQPDANAQPAAEAAPAAAAAPPGPPPAPAQAAVILLYTGGGTP